MKLTRSETREVLLNAWVEFMPASERDAVMDYWVYEWIRQEWPAQTKQERAPLPVEEPW